MYFVFLWHIKNNIYFPFYLFIKYMCFEDFTKMLIFGLCGLLMIVICADDNSVIVQWISFFDLPIERTCIGDI